LQWWVPADKGPGALASRMLQRHWLPLGQILSSRALAVGGIMLDIGANIGTTSIPRTILGDFQYIYAAEPEPLNYLCLVQNVVANGLAGYVLPDQVAISSSDGEAELIINTRMANHHLSLAPVSSDTPKHQRSTKVPCLTLDSWVSALGIDLNLVTFIKSDAQGWEGHILRGASQVLRNKHIAWQIEFWPSGLKKANFDLREIAGLVRQHFTHFVDLRGRGGPQIRQTSELLPALSYLIQGAASHTDLLLYNAAESPSFPLHKKASSAAT
jgi:FkbM family methyltransferase